MSLKIKNGMIFSHIGIFIFIISTLILYRFKISLIDIIKPGNNIIFNSFNLLFRNLSYGETKNYNTIIPNLIIENKHNESLGISFPERRSYFLHDNLISKPAINSNIFSDIYIIIGDGNIFDGWFIKIIYNPSMIGIWVGLIFIFIGGFYSINKYKKNLFLSLQ